MTLYNRAYYFLRSSFNRWFALRFLGYKQVPVKNGGEGQMVYVLDKSHANFFRIGDALDKFVPDIVGQTPVKHLRSWLYRKIAEG